VHANGDSCCYRVLHSAVYKCGKKFKAQIQIDRVQHYLGLFDTEIEAAVAYDNHARVWSKQTIVNKGQPYSHVARQIILGSRARTNFAYNPAVHLPEDPAASTALTFTVRL
jgi:hypothetical protein